MVSLGTRALWDTLAKKEKEEQLVHLECRACVATKGDLDDLDHPVFLESLDS